MNFGGGLEDIETVLCSAVLIRPDVALTAAHCVNLEAQGATFVASASFSLSFETDLRDVASGAAPFPIDATPVVDIVTHPDFDVSGFSDAVGLSQENDLAVLFLASPRSDVALPTLPPPDFASSPVGTQLTLAGYGTSEVNASTPPGDGFGRLRCINSFINAIAEEEFQAGAGATTGRRCYGDSGGPTYLRDAPAMLVGLGSRALSEPQGCVVGGVDTRLSPFLSFIDREARLACADGGPRTDCSVVGIYPPHDAGQQDAGQQDAGEQDAGQQDAGQQDAGQQNAGEQDAGEQDAGQQDAGQQDAGSLVTEVDAGQDAGTNSDAGFVVTQVDAGRQPPVNVPQPSPGPACACTATPTSPTTLPLLLGLFVGASIARRRRHDRHAFAASGLRKLTVR